MGTIPCGICNCCSPPGSPPCSPGCCKCPPTGDICFDILECQAYYLAINPITDMENWYPVASCCDEMSFTMTHALGYSLCSGMGGMADLDPEGTTCLTTGTGVGMPTGIGTGELPELWGFSGVVCDDCTSGPKRAPGGNPLSGWDDPHWYQEECAGMCLKASLCCCVSPFGDGTAGQGNRCAGGAAQVERTTSCACGIACYKFSMDAWDCHEIAATVICPVQTGTFMSRCSPCAFLENPTVTGIHGSPGVDEYSGCTWGCDDYPNDTGSTMGFWQIWDACAPDIARGKAECGVIPYNSGSACSGTCPNDEGTTAFMVLVEGVYESTCDCALGVFDLMCPAGGIYGTGVGFMKSVFVKFKALLSEG